MRRLAARVARLLRGVPTPLRLITSVALIQVVCWVSFAPPLEGPDEPAHFAYAQHLAEIGDPPVKNFPKIGAGSQSTQHGSFEAWFNLRSSLGQANAKPFWSDVDQREWDKFEKTFPAMAREDGYGPNAIAQNPPLYYAYETLPYRVVGAAHIETTAFWMRMWSGLLFLGTVVFTWLAAGELFARRRWLQTVSAGAVAMIPQLSYMGSVINPDTALATLWTAFAWLAIKLVRRGPSPAVLLAMALVVGASILTHGRGLPLAGPAAVALAVTFFRHRQFRPAVLAATAGALAIVAAALVWAFDITTSTGGSAYGGEARLVAGGFTIKGFLNYVWQFYFPALPGMGARLGPEYGFDQVFIFSFFGAMGSLEITFPGWVYDLLHIGQIAGLLALLAVLWRRRVAVLRSWPLVLVMAAMAVSLLFVLHFVAYRGMLGRPEDPVLVGRYVLPIVSLWALGIGVVLQSLPRRVGVAIGAAILTAGALLQVAGLGLTLTRFYG